MHLNNTKKKQQNPEEFCELHKLEQSVFKVTQGC